MHIFFLCTRNSDFCPFAQRLTVQSLWISKISMYTRKNKVILEYYFASVLVFRMLNFFKLRIKGSSKLMFLRHTRVWVLWYSPFFLYTESKRALRYRKIYAKLQEHEVKGSFILTFSRYKYFDTFIWRIKESIHFLMGIFIGKMKLTFVSSLRIFEMYYATHNLKFQNIHLKF